MEIVGKFIMDLAHTKNAGDVRTAIQRLYDRINGLTLGWQEATPSQPDKQGK